MVRAAVIVVVLLVSSVVDAQPSGYAPTPMPVQLTLDEQFLLERGYISDGQQVGGTVVAIFFGFGVGHAVQGRFMERGYLFAIGDAVMAAVMINGMAKLYYCVYNDCSRAEEDSMIRWLVIGSIGGGIVRTWEVVDAAVGPTTHNRKLRDLEIRLGRRAPLYTRMTPYLAPAHDSGAVAGVSLRF